MKKLLSIILAMTIVMSVFMGLGFSATAETTDALAITVNGVTTSVPVGEKFTYTYTLSDVRIINTEAVVNYDSSKIQVTAVDEDDDAYDAYKKQVFPVIYNSSLVLNTDRENRILYNFSQVNGFRFTDATTLATFEFTVLEAGETTIATTIYEMADINHEYYVHKVNSQPVQDREFTFGEFITYEAPEEPSSEEPSSEEPSSEEPSEEPSSEEPSEQPTVPVKVENVSVNYESTTAVFTWDAVEGGEKYWLYQYKPATDTYAAVKSTTTGTTVSMKNLVGSTEYKFKVIARLKDGTMFSLDNADEVVFTTKPPVAVSTLTGTAGPTTVTLTWDAIEGADKYWIHKCNTADGEYWITTSSTTNSVTLKKLRPETTYYFKISARTYENGVACYSDYKDSPLLTITTGSAESIKTISLSNTATTATITWPQFENGNKYWVLYSTTSADLTDKSHWTTVATVPEGNTYTFKKLTPDTVYYLNVCVRYTEPDTGKEEYIDYIPVTVRTAHSDEDILTFTPVDESTVTVSWSEDIGEVEKSWIYVYDQDGNEVRLVSTLTNSVTIAKLPGYENYTYKLRVRDTNGIYGYVTPTDGEDYHE